MYYLRTRAAVNAIQFTVDQTKLKELKGLRKENAVPKTEEKEKVCWNVANNNSIFMNVFIVQTGVDKTKFWYV